MISDEIRIAAYKAVEFRLDNQPDHESLGISVYIDAAIEAVEPMIRNTALEEAAKTAYLAILKADKTRYTKPEGLGRDTYSTEYAVEAKAAIRALATQSQPPLARQ
jgi:hypothetical protein